ncbi:MAG: hypothetical protein P8186_11810 [Anaerolineae bacterium]
MERRMAAERRLSCSVLTDPSGILLLTALELVPPGLLDGIPGDNLTRSIRGA